MTTSSPATPAIELTGVRRAYPTRTRRNLLTGGRVVVESFEAVRGVNLTVQRGELFALLGTNGAGKTSTVELIEGLATPSAGRIQVLGLNPTAERAAIRSRMGVVLQSSGFPPALTVAEMATLWHGTLTQPRSVDEILAAVELTHRRDVETAKLSGGERRRLDVGLAIMGAPEVLILDEPTTGLDPESRRNMWRLIESLVDDGSSVLLTTHYLEEAESLADRIAIMHGGEIVREGTLAEIVGEAPAQIRFARPERLALADLTLPGASLNATDGVLIETPTLQRTLAEVLAWAGDDELVGLTASAASLEQVFLTIADRPTTQES